jgi:hypothetical protein
MIKQLAKYGASLIALYLVVANASGMGTVLTDGANGTIGLTKSLQGR